MKREKWVWMPHAGHFILGYKCQFRLNTYVGKYIVSTVGEYLPDSQVREILAKSRGVTLEGKGDEREADYMNKIGYEEIGYKRIYETMVFRAEKSIYHCCPYRMMVSEEMDFRGYNTAADAYNGHLRLCKKWSKK